MIVKLCGITARTPMQDLGGLASRGLDWLGFIFVEASPRYCDSEPLGTPGGLRRFGVFQDASTEEMIATAQAWRLHGVQLHGSETADEARALRSEGLTVLKALHVASEAVLAEAQDRYPADSVDYFVFDSPGGGTGRAFAWDWLQAYRGTTPFLLAGGIGPGHGALLREVRHPRWVGVDLNSRFETAPGVKDLSRVQVFLEHEL